MLLQVVLSSVCFKGASHVDVLSSTQNIRFGEKLLCIGVVLLFS